MGEGGSGDVRIAVDTACAADVDNHSGLLVLDAEVGRCGADEFEGCCVVDGDHGIPLFIGDLLPLTLCVIPCKTMGRTDLVNNSIPCKSSIVDDDMNLSAAEFSRPFD